MAHPVKADDALNDLEVILARSELVDLFRRYPDLAHNLHQCAEGIVRERPEEQEIRIEAIKKAFHAITDRLSIFISYKRKQHKDAAEKLLDTLKTFGAGKIDVFLDTASLAYGEEWKKTIGGALKKANCFILLVPDNIDDREWPIFETGFFAGQMLPGEKLICLHHPITPVPNQVEMYQAAKATKEDIQELLEDILINDEFMPGLDAINRASKPRLPADALEIASLFTEPSRLARRNTMYFVKLKLSTPGVLTDMRDLLDTTLIDGQGLEEMFSYTGPLDVPFGNVLLTEDQGLKRHEDWMKEITGFIQAEISGRTPPIPFAKFAKADHTRFFRPLVRLVYEERQSNGSRLLRRFEIVFGEHLVGPVVAPDGLQIMEAAIRLAARFRTEIVRQFQYARTTNEVSHAHRLLESIERDAADEGLRNKALVSAQFVGEAQQEVDNMYIKWEEFRNEERNGRIDLAFESEDPMQLQLCLKELQSMNHRFLELSSQRYAEMVKFGGF